jgi:hypothetical protein
MDTPTKIDYAEVFDSEGTLALVASNEDVAYLSWCRYSDAVLSPNDKQKIIDVIVTALGVEE